MEYKNALITGASSGLGRALAKWFAARGARVYAAARRAEMLEALREESGGNIEPVVMDVSHADETHATIQRIDEECGGLDLVVANAGLGEDRNSLRVHWPSVSQMLAVNVNGAAATLCAALPQMIGRKRGHLVGISSLAAFRGLPSSATYSGSKAFLATFLEGLRVDLRGSGVKVTCIYPGFVKSEMTAKTKYPKPFILETADAASLMGEAIERGDAELDFPWQLSLAARGSKLLPNALFDVVARKLH